MLSRCAPLFTAVLHTAPVFCCRWNAHRDGQGQADGSGGLRSRLTVVSEDQTNRIKLFSWRIFHFAQPTEVREKKNTQYLIRKATQLGRHKQTLKLRLDYHRSPTPLTKHSNNTCSALLFQFITQMVGTINQKLPSTAHPYIAHLLRLQTRTETSAKWKPRRLEQQGPRQPWWCHPPLEHHR